MARGSGARRRGAAGPRGPGRARARRPPALATLLLALAAGAAAESPQESGAGAAPAQEPSAAAGAWDLLVHGGSWGKITLEARLRLEVAEVEPSDTAWATTLRTALGYRSPAWRGLSFFVEGENVLALDDDRYFDGVSSPNGESVIADPEITQVNRAFLQYVHDGTGTTLKGGRQRIILDDARFVGNVGWRQNEQTFDAAMGRSSFGVEALEVFYAYVWHVHRIFGDKSSAPAGTRDFDDSSSHLLNARWTFSPALEVTAFGYLLDFEGSREGFSSDSYGIRLTGSRKLGGDLRLGYLGSYAYQVDAGDNPVDYGAHYLAVDGSLGHGDWGTVGVGYELLGSDDGQARFVTPLATLHAFNGWADAFLDNGGPDGLRDLYAYVSPKLPWGLGGRLVYHRFWSDEGSERLGHEMDAVLSKPVNEHLTLLAKAAWLDGTSDGPADRWRLWLQATFRF